MSCVAGCTPTPAGLVFLVIAFTLQGLCLAAVTLRLVSIVITRAGLSSDDALSVAGSAFGLATTVCYSYIVIYAGIGYHLNDLTQLGWSPTDLNLSAISYEVVYSISINAAKMSFLSVYLRAFVDAQLHRWTKILMVCICVWVVGSSIPSFLVCPIQDLWSSTARCPQRMPLYMASGAIAIATDFAMLALPMRVVWSLQITHARKVGLTMLISLGLVVTAISIVRLYTYTLTDLVHDTTYTSQGAYFTTTLEALVCNILVNLSMIAPLCTRLMAKSRWYTKQSPSLSRTNSGLGTFNSHAGKAPRDLVGVTTE